LLDQETSDCVHIKFNSTSNFSAYHYDHLHDKSTPIFENVDVSINPENSSEILIRGSDSQQKIQFIRNDEDAAYHFFDSEGLPFPFELKPEVMYGDEADGIGAQSDTVKSPMPGTVVKVYVKPGQ